MITEDVLRTNNWQTPADGLSEDTSFCHDGCRIDHTEQKGEPLKDISLAEWKTKINQPTLHRLLADTEARNIKSHFRYYQIGSEQIAQWVAQHSKQLHFGDL